MTTKKASEKIKDEPIEQPEMPIEPEIKEVVVEKPIEVKDLSITERANLIEQVKQQDIQDHLDAEKQRIALLICPKCEKSLKINPEEYLKMGNKPKEIECPSCERLIRVYIDYRQPPETSEALITTKARGFAWETKQPGTWKDKDTVKWVENEVERAKQGNPSLSPEGQIIFRIQQLILKKQKVIK